jgi:hypothetical protein
MCAAAEGGAAAASRCCRSVRYRGSDRARQPRAARRDHWRRDLRRGIFHALPSLIPGYSAALGAAIAVVASELLILAWLRYRFFRTSFARSFLAIIAGGAIIAALSSALGVAAGG